MTGKTIVNVTIGPPPGIDDAAMDESVAAKLESEEYSRTNYQYRIIII